MNEWIFVFLVPLAPLFGYLTMRSAAQKGRDSGGEKFGWFLLGLFLPIIGLIISLVVSPRVTAPAPPAG